MSEAREILKRHWGFDHFRPMQEEIVASVIEGFDTLALLPTGGGKSICFQVPALAREGLCVAITPLIALMRDQTERLKKKGIPAVAVHSGMSPREIDYLLDNCVYGNIKFLYLSPERLLSPIFKERSKKMPISLIAVDEAHCISQWGYDFRPAYLEIAAFRETVPNANIIALTATATARVKRDIQEKLLFRNGRVFQKSFARPNLSYIVKRQEDKDRKLLEALTSVSGPAIIYVRSRKKTREIAAFLQRNGVSADYYHAGLGDKERADKQDRWIANQFRAMVATNAFGMGIDKPDVRLVVHMDLPENLESYYQEAGRAGRDGKKAFAAIIADEGDLINLEGRVTRSFPSIDFLKKVYQALANYYQAAVGGNLLASFDFDLEHFSKTFNLNPYEVYGALKRLETEGFLQLNESFSNPSRIFAPAGKKALYEFQIAHADYDALIKAILRLYGGEIFAEYVNIEESRIAFIAKTPEAEAVRKLEYLDKCGVAIYDKKKDKPQITFLTPRYDAERLPIKSANYNERRALELANMEAVARYVQNDRECRTRQLLEYFEEANAGECGVCDVCIARKKTPLPFPELREKIRGLTDRPVAMDGILSHFKPSEKDGVVEAIEKMLDNGDLELIDGNLLVWK